jgi:hypothetical protein
MPCRAGPGGAGVGYHGVVSPLPVPFPGYYLDLLSSSHVSDIRIRTLALDMVRSWLWIGLGAPRSFLWGLLLPSLLSRCCPVRAHRRCSPYVTSTSTSTSITSYCTVLPCPSYGVGWGGRWAGPTGWACFRRYAVLRLGCAHRDVFRCGRCLETRGYRFSDLRCVAEQRSRGLQEPLKS